MEEKHKCKLCFKSFANGRALGGHMRSHMLKLYVPPKAEQPVAESASSSSSEDADDTALLQSYVLRENPKRSVRVVDPDFSSVVDAASVVVQDRESEAESSKDPIRRRSTRVRNSAVDSDRDRSIPGPKKTKTGTPSKTESSLVEPEPVSSISETTAEEDVAFCLMMLSRDKWNREVNYDYDDGEEEELLFQAETEEAEDEMNSDHSDEPKGIKTKARGKYKCETCKKVFRSYQALGGHRASHKKIKLWRDDTDTRVVISAQEYSEAQKNNAGGSATTGEKIHECPVCYRVFPSGQALGGHKRSHVNTSASTSPTPTPITTNPSSAATKPSSRKVPSLIDLNLPAPIDDNGDYDYEISQVEHSVVSDVEFVNPIKHRNTAILRQS